MNNNNNNNTARWLPEARLAEQREARFEAHRVAAAVAMVAEYTGRSAEEFKVAFAMRGGCYIVAGSNGEEYCSDSRLCRTLSHEIDLSYHYKGGRLSLECNVWLNSRVSEIRKH